MKYIYFILFFTFSHIFSFSQTGNVSGYILNSDGNAESNVSVSYNDKGTVTDERGFFELSVPENKEIELIISHISFMSIREKIKVKSGEKLKLEILLTSKTEEIGEVIVQGKKEEIEKVKIVQIETIKKIPSVNSGIEGALKVTALGTSSDNELSNQYKVRGGNYDENLIYVNGIEIYRPFLVRSGQQEGLSFLNPEMTSNIHFSSGGFQAKYGDKLASVLDITYRKPENFALNTEISMLGASLTVEDIDKRKKNSAILGFRYRNNGLFVNSQDIKSNYQPVFVDVQSLINHTFNAKWNADVLLNFAYNNYQYIPKHRSTKFGSFSEPKELIVYYNGNEQDTYSTSFGAVNFQFLPDENWTFDFTSSVFNTKEHENFDIEASYNIGTPNTNADENNYGEPVDIVKVGNQIDHARNAIDALIGNAELKGRFLKKNNELNFGVKYQRENVRDRLKEWQVIDSAGFSLIPSDLHYNDQPYEPYEGPIVLYQYLDSQKNNTIDRWMGFGQWNHKFNINKHKIWTNLGIRSHAWQIQDHSDIILSPRVQISFKPNWKNDFIFRLSGGNYAQPPFYKEFRNIYGEIISTVKAQKSTQILFGTENGLHFWKRPFKLVTEVYYKNLTDVNHYTLDNVRIRYVADNNTVAYTYGFDLRLNGEFVSGTESWFNFGYLETKENIDNRGYISRPTDQRLKFGLLFQDYVPSIPNLKMYLNLVYNTGVPGGTPTYGDPYDYKQWRLSDYRRADLGVSFILKDANNKSRINWVNRYKEFSIGGEIYNLFDMENAITYTWVMNIEDKKMSGVKNYMTGRIFNLKLRMKL